MKRLIDEEGAESTKALVQALREREVDPFMETRVLGRLRAGTPRAARWKLKPVGALAVVTTIALVSVASAMVWRKVHAPAPITAPLAHSTPPEHTMAPPASVQAVRPIEAPIVESVAKKPARPSVEKKRKSEDVAPVEAAVLAPPAPEESRLLLEAYRALRQAHDADEARARVDEYLRRFPHGALVEEALVIALDASAGDPARAVPYARRYLHDVPHGNHAERARRLLASPP